ncbi:Protein F02C12.2, partial [Aphelenchoides avenae]
MSLKQRFVDKVVIITGSSTGIGRQAALDFAAEGALVTIQGENADRLKEAGDALREASVEDNRFCVVRGSLDKDETLNELVDTTLAKFGHIDVFVVNDVRRCKVFALNPPGKEGRVECFDSHFAAEFRGIMMLTELAVPHLEATKGNVVFLTSVVANIGWCIAPIYAAIKAAIESWSKTAAVKYAPKGIRVNTI